MSERRGLIRKVIYVCLIAALLVPLSLLSRPETKQSSGGYLAKMRREHRLSQAQLGDIDPAGETIKLATLGFRGIAANLLWGQANDCKMKEDWTGYSAALEQIRRLQPNFISVWRYLAWNLSYNLSVEFDDYHDRYYWVIRGINFLKEGQKYNELDPRLRWDLGWFIAQKIGRADEHVQYRALFRQDDDFHKERQRGEARDNWLVGQESFKGAVRLVDEEGVPLRGVSTYVFFSDPAMCQINYAEALEDEGRFDEVAKFAWEKAEADWTAFGARDMPSTNDTIFHLGDEEQLREVAQQAKEKLSGMISEALREKVAAEKLAALTPEERAANDTPAEKRDEAQRRLMYVVGDKLKVSELELAERLDGAQKIEALSLADTASQSLAQAESISISRDIVNYKYWWLRCQLEKTDGAIEARKLVYQGDEAKAAAYIDKAMPLYEQGFAKWREVLDKFPDMKSETIMVEDIADASDRYFEVLRSVGQPLPDKFVLQDILDKDVRRQNGPPPEEPPAAKEPAAKEPAAK